MLYNQSGITDPTAYEALKNISREKRTRYTRIYISSSVRADTKKLMKIFIRAQKEGFSPFSPVLTFRPLFDEADAVYMGFAFLDSCAQVWVVGDPDRNVKREIKRAKHQGKPVRFFTYDAREIAYDS